jgi:hypothetical protein
MKRVEYKGVWWLPEDREREIVGTLTFDRTEGLLLDAIGVFHNPFDMDRGLETVVWLGGSPETFPVIHGRTTDSKDITLCRCIQRHSSVGSGVPTSQITAHVAFVGAHLGTIEGLRFRRAAAALVHLPRWAALSGLNQTLTPHPTDRNRVAGFSQGFALPPERVAAIEDWELRLAVSGRANLDVYARALLEQTVYVQLDFPTPKGFDEIVNTVLRHIQDFLSLAVGDLTSILELTVERAEATDAQEAITVLFSQRRRGKRERVVDPGNMVFTLRDIAAQWPDPLLLDDDSCLGHLGDVEPVICGGIRNVIGDSLARSAGDRNIGPAARRSKPRLIRRAAREKRGDRGRENVSSPDPGHTGQTREKNDRRFNRLPTRRQFYGHDLAAWYHFRIVSSLIRSVRHADSLVISDTSRPSSLSMYFNKSVATPAAVSADSTNHCE